MPIPEPFRCARAANRPLEHFGVRCHTRSPIEVPFGHRLLRLGIRACGLSHVWQGLWPMACWHVWQAYGLWAYTAGPAGLLAYWPSPWLMRQEASSVPFVEQELIDETLSCMNWRAEMRVEVPVLVRGGVLADAVGYGKAHKLYRVG